MTELIVNMAGTTEAVPETVDTVARFSASIGLEEEAAHQIRVVLSEALNNIIAYALLFNRHQRIRLKCQADEDVLTIGIHDQGFPLKTSPEYSCPKPGDPCLDGCTQCGRGWPIIVHWADNVDYQRQEGQNVLTLYKTLASSKSDTQRPPCQEQTALV